MDAITHIHSGSGGFVAEWSPGLLLVLIAIAYLYFQLVGPMRNRFAGASEVSSGRKALFIASLVVFYAGQGSPINYYGHGMIFSAHMMMQSLIYLTFPPLIYLSVPDWIFRPVLMKTGIRRLLSFLLHPLVAILTFNILFSFYHIPQIFNYAFAHPVLHTSYHIVLALSAFQMWFPVFCPLPEWKQLSDLQKMAYIFANGVLLTPACALIIFSNKLLYPDYAAGLQTINFGMSPIDDQQLGGTIMKIMQELIYGTALAYTFFKWYHKEKKKDDEDEAISDREMLHASSLQSN